jgi:poly-gamma-glutamate synthesis protein (capsule biosynthesis protein)
VAFANLRTPLGAPATLGAGAVGAPADFARDLARVGFDVLQVANDHSGDLGAAGLRDTLGALRAARVLPTGVNDTDDGPFAPVIVERDGMRVAFLSCTTRLLRDPGEPRGEHDPRVARLTDDDAALVGAVTAARSAADVVVVGVHWSRERYVAVTEAQRALALRLVEAGADLVAGFGQPTVGAVSRVPSPRGEAVIAYSLGTLLSHYGQAWHRGTTAAQIAQSPWVYDPGYRDGVMLHVSFDLSAPPAVRVSRLSANAVWTSHLDEEIRVVPMRGVDERVATERMRVIGAALGPAVRLRP